MNKNKLENETTEAINLLLKMREEGRMDDEEMYLIFKILFSDEMDKETFDLIKFMHLHRPKDQSWMKEPYHEPLQVSPRSHYYD